MPGTISTQKALIYVMVTMSGVEGQINKTEMQEMRLVVSTLPVFHDFDETRLQAVAQECADMLQEPEGLQAVLGLVKDQLSPKLRETAYALAVEVAAADLAVGKEELRFLAMLRDALDLDKLVTAALERSVIARYQTT